MRRANIWWVKPLFITLLLFYGAHLAGKADFPGIYRLVLESVALSDGDVEFSLQFNVVPNSGTILIAVRKGTDEQSN